LSRSPRSARGTGNSLPCDDAVAVDRAQEWTGSGRRDSDLLALESGNIGIHDPIALNPAILEDRFPLDGLAILNGGRYGVPQELSVSVSDNGAQIDGRAVGLRVTRRVQSEHRALPGLRDGELSFRVLERRALAKGIGPGKHHSVGTEPEFSVISALAVRDGDWLPPVALWTFRMTRSGRIKSAA